MLRQFGGIWIIFFGALAAWQEFHHHRRSVAIALAILAVTIGPLGLVWPRGIRPIFIGWMALVYPIGWTVSRVVLGLIFYGLFTPVAWFFRVTQRDALGLKPPRSAVTCWQSKARATDKTQYLRQF
jgi:hypothetical protein